MFVLKHSKKWWHEECRIKCPDCETTMYQDNRFFIDIITQKHIVWKRAYAKNYDLQYRASFSCKHCGCLFEAWSPIMKDAGPPIGSGIIGDVTIRNWNGFKVM